MTWLGSRSHRKSSPTPRIPRPTTVIPITAPPGKATRMASASPSRAPWAVRALARVAICIPKNPARMEHAAPRTKETAV